MLHLKFKIPALLMVGILFLSLFSFPTKTSAVIEKETVKRTIAIVYDNSGSMFSNGDKKTWCQAQYAIEVFSSMMNNGDTLMVYPMWSVSIGSSGPQYSYQTDSPLIITEDGQKASIRDMLTHQTKGTTPIESIDAAHHGLASASGEKWLIVLTDGETFYQNDVELNAVKTKQALEEKFSQYIPSENIMYLGIGSNLQAPQLSSWNGSTVYVAATAAPAEVPSKLTEMCNTIFGRDELPKKFYTDKSVSFDVPLSKLYVFIQGENISNVALSLNGKNVPATQSFQPKYGTGGRVNTSGKAMSFEIDTTLQGYIAVYSNLEIGEYALTYSGKKSNIAFYYEPDADLLVQLADKNGRIIKNASEIVPGTYDICYSIVDKNGNVLSSELLGNTNYSVDYTEKGSAQVATDTAAGKKEVQIDDTTFFAVNTVEVTLLNNYRIRKTGLQLGFLSIPFKAKKTNAKDFSLALTGANGSYDADKIQDADPLFLTVLYDGKTLTGSDLDKVTLESEMSGEGLGYEMTRVENGYEIRLVPPEDLTAFVPGDYRLRIAGTYHSDTEEDAAAEATGVFTINDVSGKLKIKTDRPQTYFAIMDIDKAEPLRVNLTLNGEPLTEEQMDELKLTATANGLPLLTERIPGESAYHVRIDPNGELASGLFKIQISASGVTDRMGHVLETKDSVNVTVSRIPKWLRNLFILLALLLLALIILFIMTRPALPKYIHLRNVHVTVDGEEIRTIKFSEIYPHKGRRRELRIRGNANWSAEYISMTLIPAKDSYRYKKSKDRKAMVVNGSVRASRNVSDFNLGAQRFSRDEKNALVPAVNTNRDFNLPRGRININGTKDLSGSQSNYSVVADIVFEDKR